LGPQFFFAPSSILLLLDVGAAAREEFTVTAR